MKKQQSNNFIATIFGAKRISRVVLMAYILAPILIFAVGFASWTIVTPEFGFFTNGSFVGNQLMDSTKYISLKNPDSPFASKYVVGGFVNDQGHLVDTTTFDIEFDVKLGQCQTLFDAESGGTLYFTFALCFADRTESTELFDIGNFDFTVDLTYGESVVTLGNVADGQLVLSKKIADAGVTATISQIVNTTFADDGVTKITTTDNETATSSSYVFVLEIKFPANTSSDYVGLTAEGRLSLKINYTITPQTADDYRALMNIILREQENSKTLMSDVRITDYKPY